MGKIAVITKKMIFFINKISWIFINCIKNILKTHFMNELFCLLYFSYSIYKFNNTLK